MPTLGLIRAASRRHEPDLWPLLRARLAERAAEDRVTLDVPAFTWPWRIAALAAFVLPFVVPEPASFLAASGLL